VIKKPRTYHKTYSRELLLIIRDLLQNAPLGLDALHHAKNLWIIKHIKMPHCTVTSGYDVADDLVWVERMSGPLLLNNNLLVGRDRTRMGISCEVRNGRKGFNRMWYSNEPSHVPPRMKKIEFEGGKNRIWEVWKYGCFGYVLLNIHLSRAKS